MCSVFAARAGLECDRSSGPPTDHAVVCERSLLRARAARRCKRKGHVVEATPFQINADMRNIGQLEGRVADLVKASREGRLTWFVPAFQDVAVAGAWEKDPHGLLGKIAPHITTGELRVVAEATPPGWAALLRRRPDLADGVEVIRLEALTPVEAVEAAGQWFEAKALPAPEADVMREALVLATEQLGEALPGPLLRLVGEASRGRTERGPSGAIELPDLLEALAR